MKTCSKCNIEKSLNEFKYRKDTDRYESMCIICHKKYSKEYYLKNKEKLLNDAKNFYKNNQERMLIVAKNYRENNEEKVKKCKSIYHTKNSEKIREKVETWRKNNKLKRNIQEKKRRNDNILAKLVHNLRVRTNMYVKKINVEKNNSSLEIIGCKPIFLKEYLQVQFQKNMSWENYGLWHIDHIIPLSSAKSKEEIYKLCHYTNLQPMWAEENIKKSNKLIKKEIE